MNDLLMEKIGESARRIAATLGYSGLEELGRIDFKEYAWIFAALRYGFEESEIESDLMDGCDHPAELTLNREFFIRGMEVALESAEGLRVRGRVDAEVTE